jgi:hypothetical protein
VLAYHVCKSCGFNCIECEGLFIDEETVSLICEGCELIPSSESCPAAVGPYCPGCVWIEGSRPKILGCVNCFRVACRECACVIGTQICKKKICSGCIVCKQMACFDCNLEEVKRETHVSNLS